MTLSLPFPCIQDTILKIAMLPKSPQSTTQARLNYQWLFQDISLNSSPEKTLLEEAHGPEGEQRKSSLHPKPFCIKQSQDFSVLFFAFPWVQTNIPFHDTYLAVLSVGVQNPQESIDLQEESTPTLYTKTKEVHQHSRITYYY